MPEKSSRMPYAVAFAIALLIAGSAAAYEYFVVKPPTLVRVIPSVGKVGSAHAHASLLIMAKDHVANFCSPDYMLRSQYAHFEDDDCTTVHRHATGVTLPTFFKTIGVDLTTRCLTIPGETQYCNDATNHVRVMINGEEVPIDELPYYEFKNNDHVLINYGPEEGIQLKFKYNQVPSIPLDVNEPLVTDSFGNSVNTQVKTAPLENSQLK